jgi:hypothetical protein
MLASPVLKSSQIDLALNAIMDMDHAVDVSKIIDTLIIAN